LDYARCSEDEWRVSNGSEAVDLHEKEEEHHDTQHETWVL
jgi:hypothetical protein